MNKQKNTINPMYSSGTPIHSVFPVVGFLFALLLICDGALSQVGPKEEKDSLMVNETDGRRTQRLHREGGSSFHHTEKSIGLVPEIQGMKNYFFGLGLSRANFIHGEGGGSGYGTTLSIEFNPKSYIIAPKINIWTTGYFLIFGGNIGLNAIYYLSNGRQNFVLRPEIGLGFIKVYLNYGYNLFRDVSMPGLNRHSLTLSYYHTIYPWKRKG
jgi:hypothetical protein